MMKKLLLLGLAACVTSFGATVFAGDEQEASKPQMYMIYKDAVKPSMTQEYEAAIKYMISEFVAYGVDAEKINWKTVAGPELGYVYVMPIDDFAAVDGMFAAWEAAVDQIGKEKFEDIMLGAAEAMDHVDAFHVMRRADLSYAPPEDSAIPADEVKFVHYSFYYILPGKKKVLEEVAKSFAELYEAKGAKYGWSVYESVTGTDMPVFVVSHPARSESDYYRHREELDALLGEEAHALRDQVMSAIRRIEHKDGWIRADLAYPPQEKKAAHATH